MNSSHPDKDELQEAMSLIWSFVPYHAVRTAVRSGLFDKLAQQHQPLALEELAGIMNWQTRHTARLTGILKSLGLLKPDSSLTTTARTWFVTDSPLYIGSYFDRSDMLEDAYSHLEDMLQSGQPWPPLQMATEKAFGLQPSSTEDIGVFAKVLSATSTPAIQKLLATIDLNIKDSILDVGAGTGIFAKFLIESGHQGSIDLLDMPAVCAALHGLEPSLQNKVTWISADWKLWHPDKTYDAIFLNHVLHEETEQDAEALFTKCSSALNPGGKIHVMGLIEDDRHAQPLPAYFSMNLLLELGTDNVRLDWLRFMADKLELQESLYRFLCGGRSVWVAKSKPHNL